MPANEYSIPHKISQYLSDLLIKENERFLDEPIQELIERIPNLSNELKRSIDFENKLFTILSYDPILIDPRIYLHYYEGVAGLSLSSASSSETSLKKLYIERLLYHRKFHLCWQLFLDSCNNSNNNNNTLNELDEFLEIIHNCLRNKSDSYRFSLLDLIINLPQDINENNMLQQIIDSMEYIYQPDFNIEQIIQISVNMNQIYNLEELEKYYLQCQQDQNQNTFELDVLYLKRVMKLILQQQESTTTSKKSIIQNYLLQFPHITSQPGWLSSIFPLFNSSTNFVPNNTGNNKVNDNKTPNEIVPFIEASKFILTERETKLNELDILYILRSNLVKPYTIYSAYNQSSSTTIVPNTLQKKNRKNKIIINELTRNLLNDPPRLQIIYKQNMNLLNESLIIKCLNILIPFSENATNCNGLFDKFDEKIRLNIIIQSIDIVNKLNCWQLENLILKYNYHEHKFTRVLINQYLYLYKSKAMGSNRLIELTKSKQIKSRNALLEINRASLLRGNGSIDSTLICIIFDRLIQLTVPKQSDGGGTTDDHETITTKNSQFALQFKWNLTTIEKNKFHQTIRSFAQTLSLLTPDKLLQVLIILGKYMSDNQQFYYHNDTEAKNYLIKCLTNDIFQFINRKMGRNSVDYIKSLLDQINQDSLHVGEPKVLYWIEYWLFKSIVLNDYQKSLELLSNSPVVIQKRNKPINLTKFIPAIISGIIDNKQFNSIEEKFEFLIKFLSDLKLNNFNNKLTMNASVKLINEIIKSSKGNKIKNTHDNTTNNINSLNTATKINNKSQLLNLIQSNPKMKQAIKLIVQHHKNKSHS
ncbi:hypothetical protein FOB64_006746 [Candida albicans]|uniref:Uncharacterized protein n=1 Tax=Candida albicans TaxID=5476 RepID=A0A8H6F1N1_CANAX|nr:hypothetical protein FOB64_006746 [Candida albicans]